MANFTILVCVLLYFGVALCNGTCGQIFENKVSDVDKRTIVNFHNQLRRQISEGNVSGQPKPKQRLIDLKWDPSLAAQAQKIANTCEFKHVKVRDGRFYVGQNLAWEYASYKKKGANWVKMIGLWFNEYKDFSYPNKSKGMTGHYTQVIWAGTKYVGCGYTMYRKAQYYEKLYVCNYGPGGNIIGQPPYSIRK